MDEEMAKPAKQKHEFRLSDEHTRIAQKLSDRFNVSFAEILTRAAEEGLAVLVEKAKQMDIWERTSAKASVIRLIDSIPEERLQEAISYLKEFKGEDE